MYYPILSRTCQVLKTGGKPFRTLKLASTFHGKLLLVEYVHSTQYFRKLQIRRQDGFVELLLHCSKQLDESRSWSIKTEYQFKLVSTNGRSVAFYGEKVFEKPVGSGWDKLIRWENWASRCNDEFVFEASVRILNTTGIEDENDVDRFSGFAIPVEGQEYSMEKWLEMAFDH